MLIAIFLQCCPPQRCTQHMLFHTFVPIQILNLENYQNQWGDIAHDLGWASATFYVVWILIGENWGMKKA